MPKIVHLPEEMKEFFAAGPDTIPNWPADLTLEGFGVGVLKDVARSDWRDHRDRTVTFWDWWKWHDAFKYESGRFEAALRLRGLLVGLILGVHRPKPEDGGPPRLEVWYLEGRPGLHELKGQMLLLLMDLAYYYAVAIEAKELRIIEPLADVVYLYEDLRFESVSENGKAIYCSKSW